MQDIRNAVNYGMRLGVAKKGRNSDENASKFLSWFSWGHEQGNITDVELELAFGYEFQKVHDFNMDKYGRPAPWRKLKNGRYAVKD